MRGFDAPMIVEPSDDSRSCLDAHGMGEVFVRAGGGAVVPK